MKIIWLIEKSVSDETSYISQLLSSLEKLRIEHLELHLFSLYNSAYDSLIKKYLEEKIVVPLGSVNFLLFLHERYRRTNLFITPIKNFNCSYYYSILKENLLNYNNAQFTTKSDLLRNKEKFFNNNSLFIRPNSGLKEFKGFTSYKEDLENSFDLNFKNFSLFKTALTDSESIVIAPYKEILNEYRFVVTNNKVSWGCHFRNRNGLINETATTNKATNFLKGLLEKINLNSISPIFVIDVAETSKEGFKIVELNNFFMSELYGTYNLKKLIGEVNKEIVDFYNL